MKITHEVEVLKQENLDGVFAKLKAGVEAAARDGQPAHEVEESVWRQVLSLGHELFGHFLDLSGNGDMGATITLPDGRCVHRLEEEHAKRLVTIFGEFQVQRTVYGSREGQKIDFVPLDNRLQLPQSEFSYVLQDWDQQLCVEEAFNKSGSTIQRILGLKQSVDSLERMNVQMAMHVQDYREDRPRPEPLEEGAILVLSADGKGIVMRREEPAPRGHRTKGEKASQKRMAIVGAAYTVDRYERTAEQVVAALFGDHSSASASTRPEPKHKHVWASLTRETDEGKVSAIDEVYPWLFNEVAERNPHMAKEMVCLHDGQESLWDARDQHLPKKNCMDILDLLHVTPRLWQAAHVFHKEKSAEAEHFMRERLLKVLQGKSHLVVRGLREMASKRKLKGAKKKTMSQLCGYLERNRERMHYDVYLERGYPIASGVIEGACRHLVKDRMERAGMHWTIPGAQAMLDIRSTWIHGDWESYQTYYRERETARLYPYRQLVEEVSFTMGV